MAYFSLYFQIHFSLYYIDISCIIAVETISLFHFFTEQKLSVKTMAGVWLKSKAAPLWVDISEVFEEFDASDNETVKQSTERFREAIVKKSGIPKRFLLFPPDLEQELCIMEEYEWAYLKIRVSPEYMSCKEKPTKVLMEDFSKLMNDEETADFTLKTKTKNFRIHKLIFGARSSVFKAMFQSNMVEALAGEVTIEDLDEDTVGEMIHFIYNGSFSGKQSDFQSLCQAARKYQLDSMMDLINLNLMTAELETGEVADILIASKMFDQENLFKTALEKLKKGSLADASFKEKMKDHPELIKKIKKSVSKKMFRIYSKSR